MKKSYLNLCLSAAIALSIASCNKKQETVNAPTNQEEDPIEWQGKVGMPDPSNEDAGLVIAPEDLIERTREILAQNNHGSTLKWDEANHNQITYICAKKLGLSEERAKVMGEAAEMPDFTQSGIQNGFNQQWSHCYLYSYFGDWMWGDADDDLHDNIDGALPGEDHEGYADKDAGYYYNKGVRSTGDWYVGYATHYMEDVCQPLHSTFILPWTSIATHHFDYEEWVYNNWTKGHRFVDAAKGVSPSEFYHITDLKQAVYDASAYSSVFKNQLAEDLWNSYYYQDFPTGTGQGSKEAVEYTRIMIREAAKWTGGVIKYSLDKYQQWD